MNSIARRRILVAVCLFGVICVLLRYISNNGIFSNWPKGGNQRGQRTKLSYSGEPVVVAVFYEALCPDSKYFIVKQLEPTFQKTTSLIDIVFIPYGKAKTSQSIDGSPRFECQHGENECIANIYHACTIEIVKDSRDRLAMVSCMIKDNKKPKEAMQNCAKEFEHISAEQIQRCFDSTRGRELLKIHGNATHALTPPVSFIPTVTLDGSQGNQASILKDFLGEVCKIAASTGRESKACDNT